MTDIEIWKTVKLTHEELFTISNALIALTNKEKREAPILHRPVNRDYITSIMNLHEKLWEAIKAPVESAEDIKGVLSVSEAAALWGLDTSTIRRAIKDGRLTRDMGCYKIGKQWAITHAAMSRLYGPQPAEEGQG